MMGSITEVTEPLFLESSPEISIHLQPYQNRKSRPISFQWTESQAREYLLLHLTTLASPMPYPDEVYVRTKPSPYLCMKHSSILYNEKIKAREIKEIAKESKCSLCEMCLDALTHSFNTKPTSSKLGKLKTSHAQVSFKVSSLDSDLSSLINTGYHLSDETTGSPRAFQLAAFWLHQCLTTHPNCTSLSTRTKIPFLPTRVVDVGPLDGSIPPRLLMQQQIQDQTLEQGERKRAIYFTLSYRWESFRSLNFQTTTENIEEYRKEISIGKLPLVMQEAIHVTRTFGIRYLWIDALCIIQNSPTDWKKEAEDMASIYTNSFMTITACSSSSPQFPPPSTNLQSEEKSNGLFTPRHYKHRLPINTNTKFPSGALKYVFADRRHTKDGIRPQSEIDTRAWVFQEQILSRRVLNYANGEIYWNCISLNASETFPDGIPRFYDSGLVGTDICKFKEEVLHRPTFRFMEQEKEHALRNTYRLLVSQYSTRQLTHKSDKFIAFLGIAQAASTLFHDRCILGLMEKTSVTDLLWWVKEPSPKTERPERDKTEDLTDFQAPSWSWLGIQTGGIEWGLHGGDVVEKLKECIEIISIEAEEDLTSPILKGSIVLTGKLIEMCGRRTDAQKEGEEETMHYLPSWKEDILGTTMEILKCLIVAVSERYVYGLGVIPVEEDQNDNQEKRNYYKRVGMVVWRASPKTFGWRMAQKETNGRHEVLGDDWEDEQALSTLCLV